MLWIYQRREEPSMRIQEAARAAGLTKKAALYYEEAGLVHPRVDTNGYRAYTPEDVERLSRIGVLRRCGLSASEIQSALDGGDLAACARQKRDALREAEERLSVLDVLAQSGDWAQAQRQLNALTGRQSILERMEGCFPGFYGRYLRAHFGPFLRGQIETQTQREALETVISFWDELEMPPELQAACEGMESPVDADALSRGMSEAVEDVGAFLAAHQEALAWYAQYRQSEAFRQSPAYRLREALESFFRQSGYNDLFLPAMERLSPDYAAYRQKLRDADAHVSDLLKQR